MLSKSQSKLLKSHQYVVTQYQQYPFEIIVIQNGKGELLGIDLDEIMYE